MEKDTADSYSSVPDVIMQDNNICSSAKLLYGKISSLCNQKGYCWATNNYFAELYNVSKRSIQRWIDELIAGGYVVKKIDYAENNRTVLNRYLTIPGGVKTKLIQCGVPDKTANRTGDIPVTTSCQECHESSDTYITTPGDNNVTVNNISVKKINERDKENSGGGLSLSLEKFKTAFPTKVVDCDFDESKYDMDLLIKNIQECEFLKSQANITLKSCLKHYDKIIAGGYKKYNDDPHGISIVNSVSKKSYEELAAGIPMCSGPEDI